MPDPGDLCRACGLCCDGSLFTHAPLKPGEGDRLVPLGVNVRRRDEGDRLIQRCTALGSSGCGVYEDRPHACRLFKCLLLHAFEGGEVSLGEAEEVIAEGRARLRSLAAVLPAAENGEDPRTLAYRLHRPEHGRPLADNVLATWDAADSFLNRHFRGRL